MASLNEARTRKNLIDPALNKAGWDVGNPDQVGIEIPVDGFDPMEWKRIRVKLEEVRETRETYEADLPKGISDYALFRPNHEIIAVVEAKRTSFDPRLAEAQTEFYVTEIEKRQGWRPFAFMTNGHDLHFWDVGRANKRLVHGFFSPEDLENLLYLRQNRIPLNEASLNTEIAGRVYQQEALRRVSEAFEQGKRRALLVMATGTGKTRTAMSLVELFLRTNQARRILFVADRDTLVTQAKTEGFEDFIPDESCTRIFTHRIDKTNRLYAVTLQTLSNCFRQFTPGFFDLIIFDEVHRSIFNKWNEVLDYFDAHTIGLTATPADFLERNTFIEFECEHSTPTFFYSYEQAGNEGYLVDYSLYKARTKFQRTGIRGVDLSEEERNALIEQGLDPDNLDFSGTDLERKVSNKDTLRQQWEEIWDICLKDKSGQLPGKTIVFAMTQQHALRLMEVFEEMYPQHPGLARVITSQSEYKGELVKQFKKESLPRIAISVDMLETGVNVPEIVNLVFMRPVHSRIKLEQMIGRGTRNQEACHYLNRLPNGCKDEFLIIDFWDNDFNKTPGQEAAQSLPVLVNLFNTRLRLLDIFLDNQQPEEADREIADLREQIGHLPVDSFSIKKVYGEVKEVWEDSFWRHITLDKLEFLQWKVGPLLRFVSAADVQAATFTSKVERLKLQIATGDNPSGTAKSIAEDASRLPAFVYEDSQRKQAVDLCLSPQMETATMAELNEVVDLLADQMKYRKKRPDTFLNLDLPDFIEMRGYILLFGESQPVYVEEYRQRVEQQILDLVAGHPTIEALDHGEPVTDQQLIELERTLRHELGGGEVELSEENIRKAYGLKVGSLIEFLRQLLEIEGLPDYKDIVRRQFKDYIARHTFNADQIRFLRAVQNVFLQKRRLELADLYEAPLTSFGEDALDRWFTDEEVKEMLDFTDTLTVTGGRCAN